MKARVGTLWTLHFLQLGSQTLFKTCIQQMQCFKKSACNQTWHYQNTTNTSRTKQHYCCSYWSLTQTWQQYFPTELMKNCRSSTQTWQPHFPHTINEKLSCRSDEAIRQTTNRQFFAPSVRCPSLGLQDEFTTWSQLLVHSGKHSLQAIITPVQVDPFGDAESQDGVILFFDIAQLFISLQHVIALKQSNQFLTYIYILLWLTACNPTVHVTKDTVAWCYL